MSKSKDISIKIIVEISRIILGITFIFSGFVKSIDPMGTTYKIQDYLNAFGLPELNKFALIFAIILCAGELCLGLYMFLGLYRKWTSWLLFFVLLFMTPLTLYLAIANPVKDCGCFGDALIITNWQTFFKNIILLTCSIITLVWHERITNFFTGKFYWFVGLYIVIFSIGLCMYNYYNEPIIDFRPYKIGNNIPKLMTVDKDKAPIYENIFIYEKDGVKKEFTETNYPWQDSTWVFVDRISKLIKEGDEPAIKDFEVTRLYLSPDKSSVENEENLTTELLADTNYTFLMVAYSLTDMDETYLSRFEDVNNYAGEYGYKFYCLTSSPQETILRLEKNNITNFDFCSVDERTLKTMVRSNPGLILLKDGTIINKWASRNTPDEAQLNKPIEDLKISQTREIKDDNKNHFYAIILILVIPLLAIKIFDAFLYQKKAKKQTTN